LAACVPVSPLIEGDKTGRPVVLSPELEHVVNPEILIEMAETYRMLGGLNPQQLRSLATIAYPRQYSTGQVIFQIGEEISYFHLIVSGDVGLEQMSGDEPLRVQTLHHGDALGCFALSEGDRAHFQARALSAVTTVAFHGPTLRAACDRDPAMGYVLLKRLLDVISERVDATRSRIIPHEPWVNHALA
jgi:CRP/FNR family cyclic AMP-dependent transcriptional regulator